MALQSSWESAMNYFDAIAGSSFKKTKDGRWAFYPWGIFGAGYILSDEEKHLEARNFARRYYLVSLLLIVLVGLFLGWSRALFLSPFVIGVYVFVVRRQLHGLAKTQERLTLAETLRQQARGYNRFPLGFRGYLVALCCCRHPHPGRRSSELGRWPRLNRILRAR
jgi:hypothetical protein